MFRFDAIQILFSTAPVSRTGCIIYINDNKINISHDWQLS